MFDNWQNILTRHHQKLSLTGFAVGSIENSLRNLMQLRKFLISNPRIYSLAIARHCLLQGMPLARSSTLCAILFSLLTPLSVFLSNHLSSPRHYFAVGANEHSLCIFRQLAYLCLTIDKTYSIAIIRNFPWHGFPLARSRILSATWCSFVNF